MSIHASVLSRRNVIAGGLYGLLIGDAVGRCYEFKPAADLPPPEAIAMRPPSGYPATYPFVPAGTWTDDGAQALALLDSLLECGRLDLEDFGARLLAWCDEGAYTPDGQVFDIGMQTARAFSRMRAGIPAARAGDAHEHANGNGALMRVLPLALWHRGADAELVRLAIEQGRPTHGHPRSGVACATYCLLARRLLQGETAEVETLADGLGEFLDATERSELDRLMTAPERAHPAGTGYVVDTFWSALRALEASSYDAVIRAAVGFGNDTDTTACIAGGLAGIRFGIEGIPADWKDELRGRDRVEGLLERLARV
ncbi:ADP-ribosylglycohydrolase family protein [Methylococcus sp. Mc7]|jgi:ADP-ribosyl-[dinitrogen reductase] hydrolase|uniref:ADP-ribosylglycohydrolase family protein n=1 Tax=Methylococcus sp. Mc7 TaxID=2860258 RepID=UPI001C533FBF|nr:ADP-ribosylglycohydrolase family protein [Methylococcus sp. Mc7]QXP84750.1 ADP-ribosylglycohydrolase family protein [Methylococcus sp. Mc7]